MDAWPFVGRESELASASAALRRGEGVIVVGEPGIGKSALCRQIGADAEHEGAVIITVMGRAVGRTPFEAFAGIVHADRSVLTVSAAADRVIALGEGHPLVIVVDDIDLVDEQSGHVLVQLAARGVRIVASARGPRLGGAGEALWRTGWCERRELGGISESDVTELLETALSGPVDSRTVADFTRRSVGNPLVLRELVQSARDAGAFMRAPHAWHVASPPPVGGGVRELIARRFAGLSDADRAVLELIAAGEPVPRSVALVMAGEDGLIAVERARVIVIVEGLEGAVVRTAHPLYGEIVRDELPSLRLRRLRLALAGAFETQPHARPHDLVRAAIWRLEAEETVDADRLLAAARVARSLSLDLAEQLARRAHETGRSLDATLLLAEILTHIGNTEEAAAVLATLPTDELAPAEREVLAYCTAVGGGLLSGDIGSGAEFLTALVERDLQASSWLRALQSSMLAFDARFVEAMRIGEPLVADSTLPAATRAMASMGVVGAYFWLGRYEDVRRTADALRPLAHSEAVRAVAPYVGASLELLDVCALIDSGYLDDAAAGAQRMAVEGGVFLTARSEYCAGLIAHARGRETLAQRTLRRALADLGPFDEFMTGHLAATLASAMASAGDAAGARGHLVTARSSSGMTAYRPATELAEAAVLAAELRMPEAADRAAWAAGLAADRSQWTTALSAWHDAARYGASRYAVTGAEEAGAHVEGPLAATKVDHVRALAGRDADALDELAERFAAMGMAGLAVESAQEAALAHTARGERRAAARSLTRAVALRAQTDAVAPWLAGAGAAIPLTARERQVAALAAGGESDAGISDRLGISIRTVQTHLEHSYAKLGVNRRSQLSGRLSI